jgi:hypothetical protein
MLRHLPLALMLAITGCSGSMPGAAQPSAPTVFPTALYLGVEDGGAKYGAPVAVDGAGPMAYSIADAAVASASGDDATLEVGALHPGATDVLAKNAMGQATVHVTVTTYSAAQRLAGQQAWAKFGCAGCHDSGPDVTPSGIGKHTDAQLEAVVTMGANPEGGDVSIGKSQHSFAIASTDAAFLGIAAYMRSVPARGRPIADQ